MLFRSNLSYLSGRSNLNYLSIWVFDGVGEGGEVNGYADALAEVDAVEDQAAVSRLHGYVVAVK